MKNTLNIIIVFVLMLVLFASCAENENDNTSNNSPKGGFGQEQSPGVSGTHGTSYIPNTPGIPDIPTLTSMESSSQTTHSVGETAATTPDLLGISLLDSKKYGWGPGKIINNARPSSPIQYQKNFGKYDSYFIGSDEKKKIYLTFDEGYENGYTATILDTLKEKKIHAVFFITYDYAKRNAPLVKRMIAEGHVVGNHTQKHPSMPTISLERAKEEIMFLHDYIKTEFDYEMNLFRFPMGEYNEQTLALCKSLGYKSVFWSFAYVDWDVNNQMGAENAYTTVINGAHNGAIYLLHAVSKDNNDILGRVIDNLTAQGYMLSEWDL